MFRRLSLTLLSSIPSFSISFLIISQFSFIYYSPLSLLSNIVHFTPISVTLHYISEDFYDWHPHLVHSQLSRWHCCPQPLLIFGDEFQRSYVCRCSLREWHMLLANSSISSSFLPHSDSITWVTNEDCSALYPIFASVYFLNTACKNLFHSAELRNGAPPSEDKLHVPVQGFI